MKRSITNPQSRRAITLIEILLVVAIMLVLASMVVPQLVNRQEQANIDATKLSIEGIAQSLKIYALDHDGQYPNNALGLRALIDPSDGDSQWRGPYLERNPNDAWGREFQYVFNATSSRVPFNIVSAGPDGVFGNGDDIEYSDNERAESSLN